MGKHIQFDLRDLEAELGLQAQSVEEMVQAAYRGLSSRCLGAAAEVHSREQVINRNEVAIEERCLRLLAIHQPVAVDLRRVAAALKINSDLERIADLAVNLAERTEDLMAHDQAPIPDALEQMVSVALAMLRDANTAFVNIDASLAENVCRRDDGVDELNRSVIRGLVTEMEANPDMVPGLLHVFSASRIVERIADHATNIAEDVIYLARGEITRHHLDDTA